MKLLFISALLVLTACTQNNNHNQINFNFNDVNCQDSINRVVARYGYPEEQEESYSSNGAHTLTYWYWSQGYSVDFLHGTRCTIKEYFHQPIYTY